MLYELIGYRYSAMLKDRSKPKGPKNPATTWRNRIKRAIDYDCNWSVCGNNCGISLFIAIRQFDYIDPSGQPIK